MMYMYCKLLVTRHHLTVSLIGYKDMIAFNVSVLHILYNWFKMLFFSLDPDEDPLAVLLMIDFYALRSEQFDFLVRLFEEWGVISRSYFNKLCLG